MIAKDTASENWKKIKIKIKILAGR